MEIEEEAKKFFDELPPVDQLLALIITTATQPKEATAAVQKVTELMHEHFTQDAAIALASLAHLVIDTTVAFKTYYHETYREKAIVVEGTDTIN